MPLVVRQVLVGHSQGQYPCTVVNLQYRSTVQQLQRDEVLLTGVIIGAVIEKQSGLLLGDELQAGTTEFTLGQGWEQRPPLPVEAVLSLLTPRPIKPFFTLASTMEKQRQR